MKTIGKFADDERLKRGDIHSLFGDPSEVSFNKDRARIKALLWIHTLQTEDERNRQTTNKFNGVGFSGIDGKILSSFADQVYSKQWLSDKQMDILRRKMKKYENQMVMIANYIKNGGQRDGRIEDTMTKWATKNKPEYERKNLFESEEIDLIESLFESEQSAHEKEMSEIKNSKSGVRVLSKWADRLRKNLSDKNLGNKTEAEIKEEIKVLETKMHTIREMRSRHF